MDIYIYILRWPPTQMMRKYRQEARTGVVVVGEGGLPSGCVAIDWRIVMGHVTSQKQLNIFDYTYVSIFNLTD